MGLTEDFQIPIEIQHAIERCLTDKNSPVSKIRVLDVFRELGSTANKYPRNFVSVCVSAYKQKHKRKSIKERHEDALNELAALRGCIESILEKQQFLELPEVIIMLESALEGSWWTGEKY